MIFNLFNGIAYYIAWIALLRLCNTPYLWVGMVVSLLYISVHFMFTKERRADFYMLLICIIMGIVLDGSLSYFGIIQFKNDPILFPIPLWLMMVWSIFAVLFNHSLRWMRKSYLIQIVCAGIFAPTSYYSGYKLNAVNFQNIELSMIVISVVWMIVLPLLHLIATKLSNENDE